MSGKQKILKLKSGENNFDSEVEAYTHIMFQETEPKVDASYNGFKLEPQIAYRIVKPFTITNNGKTDSTLKAIFRTPLQYPIAVQVLPAWNPHKKYLIKSNNVTLTLESETGDSNNLDLATVGEYVALQEAIHGIMEDSIPEAPTKDKLRIIGDILHSIVMHGHFAFSIEEDLNKIYTIRHL